MAEIIEDDLDDLNDSISYAEKTKDPNAFLNVAIKAKEVADLIFEKYDDVSDDFIKYKVLSGDYYIKVAKGMKFSQAYLMAAIMYLQANDFKKARKALNKITKRKSSRDIDPVVLEIVIEILNDNYQTVRDKFNRGEYSIDDNIKPDLKNLFRYLDSFRKNSEKK